MVLRACRRRGAYRTLLLAKCLGLVRISLKLEGLLLLFNSRTFFVAPEQIRAVFPKSHESHLRCFDLAHEVQAPVGQPVVVRLAGFGEDDRHRELKRGRKAQVSFSRKR